MFTPVTEPIDKALVHKRDERNVLVGDLRLELLPRLSQHTLEEVETRDPAAADVLRRFYAPGRLEGLEGWDDGNNPLVLTSLLPVLRVRPAELDARLTALEDDDRTALAALYQPRGSELVLSPEVDETAHERLLDAFGAADAALSIEDKLRVSHALELLDDPPRAYAATLVVDTSHEFFFEHPNEHVPALLMLEAIRQFVMATEHEFRRLPLETQIILTSFSSRFTSYVDLCLPVTLHCRELGREAPRAGRIVNNVRLTASVRQAGRVAATFEISGDAISHALFERARRNRAPLLAGRVFAPRPHVQNRAIIEAGGSTLEGQLTTAWLEGFRVRLPSELAIAGSECTFALSFPELEVRGGARVVAYWPEDGAWCAELEIGELGRAEQLAYHKAITQNCVWTGSAPVPALAAEPARLTRRTESAAAALKLG